MVCRRGEGCVSVMLCVCCFIYGVCRQLMRRGWRGLMRWCLRPDGSSSANVEVWSVYIGGDRRAHSLNAKEWKSWCSSVRVGAQFIRCGV